MLKDTVRESSGPLAPPDGRAWADRVESLVASVPAARAALGAGAVTVVTAVGKALGLGLGDLPVLAVVVGVTAIVVPLGYALLVAATGWAMLTGFAVNTGGRLTFSGADLRHLALLAAVAAGAWALGARRALRAPVRGVRPAPARAGTPVHSR